MSDIDWRETPPGEPEEGEACEMPESFERELELGRMVTEPPAYALERTDLLEKLRPRPGRLRPALTGGIASGKSTVAEMFTARGAKHIDFDQLARRAVAPGSPGLARVADLLGPEVLTPEGTLDRAAASALVFRDPELKAGLEAVIHPLAWDLMGRELAEHEEEPLVVISVPLLFEAGLETFFSPIVLVFADLGRQIARLRDRRPELSEEEARRIIDSQWPAPPKVMGSTHVLNNSGPLEDTRKQFETVWGLLTA